MDHQRVRDLGEVLSAENLETCPRDSVSHRHHPDHEKRDDFQLHGLGGGCFDLAQGPAGAGRSKAAIALRGVIRQRRAAKTAPTRKSRTAQ